MIARRGPQYPNKGKNPWPKAKHRRTPKRSGATKLGHHHQWAPRPVVAATVWLWWAHGHGGACFTRLWGFPSRATSTSGGFCFVLPLSADVSGHSRDRIHSHFCIHSFRVVFRERKKERRRTARILHRAWWSKDGSTYLDELFFFFSTLFSI